jgi:predicted HTH domain antitoxin
MTSISARIPDEEEEELRKVSELLGEDKSSTIRKALREGLEEIRVRLAVERYQSGEVSVNQAARIAGISVAEWLEVARERNLTTQLKPEDLEDDADSALDI